MKIKKKKPTQLSTNKLFLSVISRLTPQRVCSCTWESPYAVQLSVGEWINMSGSVDVEWWSQRKLKVFLEKYGADITGIEHDKRELVKKAREVLEQNRETSQATRRRGRRQRVKSQDSVLPSRGAAEDSASGTGRGGGGGSSGNSYEQSSYSGRRSESKSSRKPPPRPPPLPSSTSSSAGGGGSGWGHRSGAARGKKIIFLDVDGVLNTHDQGRSLMGQRRPGMTDIEVIRADIHKQLLKRLAWVCRETGSEVVLSSAWRCLDDYRDELIKHLRMEGIRYIGDTLSLPLRLETQDGKCLKTHEKQRVVEILLWLQENGPVRSWVVVDDMDLWAAAGPIFSSHMVQTKPLWGFTKADAEYMIRLLEACGNQPAKSSEMPRPRLEVRAYGKVTAGLGGGARNNAGAGASASRSRSNSVPTPSSVPRPSVAIPEMFGIDPNVTLPPHLAIQINSNGEAILQPRRKSFLGRLMGL